MLEQVVKLKHFQKFENTTEALAAATALVDSKLSKGSLVHTSAVQAQVFVWPSPGQDSRALPARRAGLKKLLKKQAQEETLAVLDSKLGNIVKEKLGIDCVYRCAPFHRLHACSSYNPPK